jgi:hypothetical protein
MFGTGYFPLSPLRAPLAYGAPLMWPFRSLIGTGLTIAGIIVIANMVAPQLVEQTIPHWKSNYGSLIAIAVGLGFLRAIWRLFIPIVALGFWIVAVFALTRSAMPTSFAMPKAQQVISQSVRSAPANVSFTTTKPLHGTKALPDAAFFPARQTQGLGFLSKIPGVSAVAKLFK